MFRFFRQYYPVRNLFFVIGEGLFIYSSFLLASWIISSTDLANFNNLLSFKVFLVTFVCQLCLYYNDLYDLKNAVKLSEMALRLLQALGLAAILLALIQIIVPGAIIGGKIVLLSIGLVFFLVMCWRICYMLILDNGMFNQKVLLLGSADLIKDIKHEISKRKDCGYTVAAEFPEMAKDEDSKSRKKIESLCGERYEGLAEIARYLEVNKIIAAFKEKRKAFPTKELLKCRVDGIEVIDGNSFYEMLTGKLFVKQVTPSWLIFSEGFQKSRMQFFLKRIIDLVLSLLMLIIFSPLILITAILIKIDSKGPVFFSQNRLGDNRKLYRVYKFRSMVYEAEKECGPVWCTEEDDRITTVGRILRKYRIDELPQLWNVLKGEMSFVGPRPEREFFVKELEKEIPYYGVRFTVKPGITGWAQVCYPYGSSVEDAIEKLNYELFYIKNMSPLMDLMIVLRTIKIVLFGSGAR